MNEKTDPNLAETPQYKEKQTILPNPISLLEEKKSTPVKRNHEGKAKKDKKLTETFIDPEEPQRSSESGNDESFSVKEEEVVSVVANIEVQTESTVKDDLMVKEEVKLINTSPKIIKKIKEEAKIDMRKMILEHSIHNNHPATTTAISTTPSKQLPMNPTASSPSGHKTSNKSNNSSSSSGSSLSNSSNNNSNKLKSSSSHKSSSGSKHSSSSKHKHSSSSSSSSHRSSSQKTSTQKSSPMSEKKKVEVKLTPPTEPQLMLLPTPAILSEEIITSTLFVDHEEEVVAAPLPPAAPPLPTTTLPPLPPLPLSPPLPPPPPEIEEFSHQLTASIQKPDLLSSIMASMDNNHSTAS